MTQGPGRADWIETGRQRGPRGRIAGEAIDPDRRVALRAGVAATLWAFAGRMSAQAAVAPDGFRPLAAGPAEAQLLEAPAPSIAALGYGAATPGPLLRLRKGEELKVRLSNKLAEPTTLCWAGLRIPNAMAGIGGLTQPPVPPGGSFDYRFTPPDSGFNLYRPHVGAATAGQIALGLYGPIIVEEASPPACDLEAIVALADWRLDARGAPSAATEAARGLGGVGPLIAANNRATPLTLSAAPGARVRLRLVNAAAARIMTIRVEGAKPLIIALDGQPAEAFAPLHNAFPMTPGARFDMLFDMPRDAASARFILLGGAAAPIPGEADRALIVFSASGDPVAQRPPIVGLAANPLLPIEISLQRARRVDLTIAGGGAVPFSINGKTAAGWPAAPLFAVPRGAPVTLGFVNSTAVAQVMRIHGHVMRLLHPMDDGWEPYWRDIVLIAPGKTSHVAFVADNPGHWPIESAIAEHMATGVMTMFAVG